MKHHMTMFNHHHTLIIIDHVLVMVQYTKHVLNMFKHVFYVTKTLSIMFTHVCNMIDDVLTMMSSPGNVRTYSVVSGRANSSILATPQIHCTYTAVQCSCSVAEVFI